MNRLVCDDFEWLHCLQWQKKGMLWLQTISFYACSGFPWKDLCWPWQELSASSAGQEQESNRLKS